MASKAQAAAWKARSDARIAAYKKGGGFKASGLTKVEHRALESHAVKSMRGSKGLGSMTGGAKGRGAAPKSTGGGGGQHRDSRGRFA